MLAETRGKTERRYRNIFHTERASARFAVEVYVVVVMMAFALLVAQFIVHHPTSVLKGVYHVVLEE